MTKSFQCQHNIRIVSVVVKTCGASLNQTANSFSGSTRFAVTPLDVKKEADGNLEAADRKL